MLKVAIVFIVGCLILFCNAILCILPLVPTLRLRLPEGCIYLEGALSVLSCSLFLLGSTFSFIETLRANEDSRPGFASQMQGFHSTGSVAETGQPASDPPASASGGEDTNDKGKADKAADAEECRTTANSSWTRHLHLTFFASLLYLCSSTLYCGTSIASLATIIQDGSIPPCVRYPQLLAAFGFAIGSLLGLIKMQKDSDRAWWNIKLSSHRFHINFWNFIGSVGFMFCAYFGLLDHAAWAHQEFGYSYLWGSLGFLAASCIDWHRSMRTRPTVAECARVERSPV